MSVEQVWNDNKGRNQRTQRRNCPCAILSTKNSKWTMRGFKEGSAMRGWRLTPWAMLRTFPF